MIHFPLRLRMLKYVSPYVLLSTFSASLDEREVSKTEAFFISHLLSFRSSFRYELKQRNCKQILTTSSIVCA